MISESLDIADQRLGETHGSLKAAMGDAEDDPYILRRIEAHISTLKELRHEVRETAKIMRKK